MKTPPIEKNEARALLVARFAALDAAIAEDEAKLEAAKAWRHGATAVFLFCLGTISVFYGASFPAVVNYALACTQAFMSWRASRAAKHIQAIGYPRALANAEAAIRLDHRP